MKKLSHEEVFAYMVKCGCQLLSEYVSGEFTHPLKTGGLLFQSKEDFKNWLQRKSPTIDLTAELLKFSIS